MSKQVEWQNATDYHDKRAVDAWSISQGKNFHGKNDFEKAFTSKDGLCGKKHVYVLLTQKVTRKVFDKE